MWEGQGFFLMAEYVRYGAHSLVCARFDLSLIWDVGDEWRHALMPQPCVDLLERLKFGSALCFDSTSDLLSSSGLCQQARLWNEPCKHV